MTALQAVVGHMVSRPWGSSWTPKRQPPVQNDDNATDNLVKIVVILVRAKVNVNAADSHKLNGRTALQKAAKNGQLAVIDVLKEAGAV